MYWQHFLVRVLLCFNMLNILLTLEQCGALAALTPVQLKIHIQVYTQPLYPRFLLIPSSISVDSTNLCVELSYLLPEKKPLYQRTCAIQAHAVQESTAPVFPEVGFTMHFSVILCKSGAVTMTFEKQNRLFEFKNCLGERLWCLFLRVCVCAARPCHTIRDD